MAEPFNNLIIQLQGLLKDLKDHEGGLLKTLENAKLITNQAVPDGNLSKELQNVLTALISQDSYTAGTVKILNGLPTSGATLEKLEIATNLIQIYFQVTEPLDQILSGLIDLVNVSPTPLKNGVDLITVQNSIQQIKTDRDNLREAETNILQEFGNFLDELDLDKLVQISSTILQDQTNSANLPQLLTEIERFLNHLENAGEFFQKFSKSNGNLTDREPNQIKTLIRNWKESVNQIEIIETTNPNIQSDLSDPAKSRLVIAQSIKIHDLLETNYDYLTALVRSIDLVSAGSL
jgi:hypothetical protein